MHNTAQQEETVVQTFQNMYGADKTLTVYSISIIPDDEHCLNYDRQHFSPYRFCCGHSGRKSP